MSSTDSESVGEGPALQSSRKRRPDNWVRSVKKAKRDSGQAYVSSTAKQVAPKELGPPCACANKCYDKVGDDNVKLLFDSYWALKSHDLQSQYLNKRVSECEVRRSRVKGRESRKKFSKEYSVLVNNSKIIVCLAAFLNIHAISYKRVRNVCSKVSASPTGALAPDQRGRHEPYHKTSPAHLQLIQRFVKSLPTCTSHYSRTKNPDKLYLPPGSTWAGLYDAFKKYMVDHDEEENAIKQSRFILEVQNYKIGIRPPKSDTCSTCDHFKTQMEELDSEEHREELAQLGIKKMEHQFHAKAGHNFLQLYTKDKTPGIYALSVDLQQTLVTPRLTTSAQYYRCKMWTYNLGIHDLKTNKAFFYVWNESEARRGSSEVASCLNHFIETYVPDETLKLVVFSDNCAGQNKNINVVLFYLRLIHANRFSSIVHFFLESGHSFLPCDRDFGVFEKHLKGKEVYTTDHYTELMRTHRRKDQVTVVRMEEQHFLDFEVLQQHVSKGGQTASGFKAARRLMVSNDFKLGIKVSAGYMDGGYHEVREWQLQKGKGKKYNPTKFNLSAVPLPVKYPGGVTMNKKKLQHLQDLCKYVPQSHRTYFTRLFETQQSMTAGNASEDVDDPADDVLDY